VKIVIHIYALSFLLCVPAFGDWGSNIMSVDAVKHWLITNERAQVQGIIVEVVGPEGFILSDDTGELRVHLGNQSLCDFAFQPNMRVEVRGIVERDNPEWDLEASGVQVRRDLIIGH